MHWRHIKIRNPLKPRTRTLRETLIAGDAAKQMAAEKEEKRLERERRASLARLENREGPWSRTKRILRGISRRIYPRSLPKGMMEAMGDQAAAMREN